MQILFRKIYRLLSIQIFSKFRKKFSKFCDLPAKSTISTNSTYSPPSDSRDQTNSPVHHRALAGSPDSGSMANRDPSTDTHGSRFGIHGRPSMVVGEVSSTSRRASAGGSRGRPAKSTPTGGGYYACIPPLSTLFELSTHISADL